LKTINKLLIILLWLIIFPIIIISANYRYFYFINSFNNLIIFILFLIAIFIVITFSIIFGFKDLSNNKLNINYEKDPIKELFDLAQKFHLDLEINDALKIYDEIKKKYPDTIHEKKAQLEINRILGNHKDNKSNNIKDKALEVLRIGYAKGEISKKDFEQRKKDLEK
jgi:hypothetical protein